MTKKYTTGVQVTPHIGVDVTSSIEANIWDDEATIKILRQAIEAVRDMDADELKKLVIEGLVDADMYPRDFAEY